MMTNAWYHMFHHFSVEIHHDHGAFCPWEAPSPGVWFGLGGTDGRTWLTVFGYQDRCGSRWKDWRRCGSLLRVTNFDVCGFSTLCWLIWCILIWMLWYVMLFFFRITQIRKRNADQLK
jgi:hypothetical protein